MTAPQLLYEAEVIPGLETVAAAELRDQRQGALRILHQRKGLIQFTFTGGAQPLLGLRSVSAIYALHTFAVPRPKALLGHQHFQVLLALLRDSLALHPPGTFSTLGIDAAGSDSSVMQRLRAELAAPFGLHPVEDKGDLLLRLRRALHTDGWDALVRLTPRPLATRPWRVCNYEGALNATVAHAMLRLSQPTPDDRCLNLMCGSATLLIERTALSPLRWLVGCDLDPDALECARANLHAAQVSACTLLQADVRQLPLPTGYITHLYADLPFGQLVGSHQENMQLYPAVLREAARVAMPDAVFTLITHELRLIEDILRHQSAWQVVTTHQISLSGLHPRIYLLRKLSLAGA